MNKIKNSISLVINTKNEEKNLKDCIESAIPIIDEIIVVDMQSKDQTIQIAKKYNAHSYTVKDYGYVEPARNFALKKATKDWILLLDADERLTPYLCKIIPTLINKKYNGFYFPRKNIILKKWIQHGVWWPDYSLKLFRNGFVKWSDKIHSQPELEGKSYRMGALQLNAIIHHNIIDIDDLVQSLNRYSDAEKDFKTKNITTVEKLISYLDSEFKWRYIEHLGYLDGLHGFILGKFMNFYRLLEFSKFWESNNYEDFFNPLDLKKAVIKDNYNLQQENEKLKIELNKIQSSKFYLIWQLYCQKRDNIKNKLFK